MRANRNASILGRKVWDHYPRSRGALGSEAEVGVFGDPPWRVNFGTKEEMSCAKSGIIWNAAHGRERTDRPESWLPRTSCSSLRSSCFSDEVFGPTLLFSRSPVLLLSRSPALPFSCSPVLLLSCSPALLISCSRPECELASDRLGLKLYNCARSWGADRNERPRGLKPAAR